MPEGPTEPTEDTGGDEVPPVDPLLDTAVRRVEAGADEKNPFGVRGRPLGTRSPFRVAFTAALGVALAYVILQAVVVARQVLVLVVVSAFLAIGLEPAVAYLIRRGLRRSLAVLVVTVLVLGLFGGFVAAVVPPITRQATQLVDKAPDYVQQLQDKSSTLRRIDERFHVLEKVKAQAAEGPTLGLKAAGGILSFGKAVLGAVFSTLTVIILTVYFLANLPAIKRAAYRLVPRSRRARVGLLSDEVLARVGGYVLGNLATSVVAGTTTYVYLLVTGVPYPVALALVVAILDLVPLVGATIGAVVVTIVALFQSLWLAVVTLVFFIAYQQFENYVLQPRVMKRAVAVPPVVTIVAALIGAALLGIVGALLAIPAAAAVQLVLEEVVYPRQDDA